MGNWRSNYHGAHKGEQDGALGATPRAQGSSGDVHWDAASFEGGAHTDLVNKLSHCLHIQPLSGASVPTLKTQFPPHLSLSPEQGSLQLVHSELEGIAIRLSDLEDRPSLRTTYLEASRPGFLILRNPKQPSPFIPRD